MAPETAYVIDFDGTVTTRDITTELGLFFGGAKFVEIDQSYQAKQIPIKSWLQAEVTLLPADLEKLKHKALEWAEIRPGFKTFLQKARAKNNPVIIASDGLLICSVKLINYIATILSSMIGGCWRFQIPMPTRPVWSAVIARRE